MVRHCCKKWRKTKPDEKDNGVFLVSIINSLFCLNVTFGSKLFKSVWFNLKWFTNMAYYLTHHSQHIMSTLWTNEFDNWCVKPYRLTPSFNFLSYGETHLAKFMLCSCYISIWPLPNTCYNKFATHCRIQITFINGISECDHYWSFKTIYHTLMTRVNIDFCFKVAILSI